MRGLSRALYLVMLLAPAAVAEPTQVAAGWPNALLQQGSVVEPSQVVAGWPNALLQQGSVVEPTQVAAGWPNALLQQGRVVEPSQVVAGWPNALLQQGSVVEPTQVVAGWPNALLQQGSVVEPTQVAAGWPNALLQQGRVVEPSQVVAGWPNALLQQGSVVEPTQVAAGWPNALLQQGSVVEPSQVVAGWPNALLQQGSVVEPTQVVAGWPNALLQQGSVAEPTQVAAVCPNALFQQGSVAQLTRPGQANDSFDPNRLVEPSRQWAVVVGASQYQHLSKDDWLPGCKKDALAWAAFLKSPRGGAFPEDHVQVLVDEKATVAAVRLALESVVRRHQKGDVVQVFFACHGKVESFGAAEVGYLMLYDSDEQHLNATAYPMEELKRTLDLHMRGAHVVLITDACHSGSIVSPNPDKQRRTLTALSDYLLEIGERKGSLHIVACRRDESSIEDPRLDGHGILTYCLLQALNGMAGSSDGKLVRTQDVIDFIGRQVPKISFSQQHPRHSNGYIDEFPLARLDQPGPNWPLAPFPGDVLAAGGAPGVRGRTLGAATLTIRGGQADCDLYLVQGSLQRTVGRVLSAGNSIVTEGLEPGEYMLVESGNSGQRQWKVELRSGLQTFDARQGELQY